MTGYTTVWVRPGSEDYHYAGPYGTADGSSYANAIAGLKNVTWSTPRLQVIVAGVHIKKWTGTGTVTMHGAVQMQGGSSGHPVIIRGDASRFDAAATDALISGGMIDSYSGAWTDLGGGVWSRTSSRFSLSTQRWGNYFTGTETTPEQFPRVTPVATLAECQATEGTSYLVLPGGNPHTIYIHLPVGVDPQTNYITPFYGYAIWLGNRQIVNRIQFLHTVVRDTTYVELRRCTMLYGNIFLDVTGDKPGNIFHRNLLSHGTAGVYVFSVNGTPPQVSNNIRVTGCHITDIGNEWFNEQPSDAHAIAARHAIDDYYIDGCKTERTGHPIVMYNYDWGKKCKRVVVKRTVIRSVITWYRFPNWNGIALNPADSWDSGSWLGYDATGNVVERCYVEGTGMDYPIRNGMTVDYSGVDPTVVWRCLNNQVDNGQYGIVMANAVALYPTERSSTGYLRGNVLRWQTTAHIMQLGGTETRKNYARNGGLDSNNNTLIAGTTPPTSRFKFGASQLDFTQWKAESIRFDPTSTVT